jgi:2-polyprenyl-3-methyl-5-hydroxy-6-metoxy-1,4-benzoquinol methylase
MVCLICGGDDFQPFLNGDLRDWQFGVKWKGEIRRCAGCGTVQQYPMLTQEQAFSYYPDEYAHYHPDTSRLRAFLLGLYFRKIVALLRHLGASPGDRLLDIGAGCGEKSAHLRKALGLDILCIEPHPKAAQAARESFGLEVVTGFFPNQRVQPNGFKFVYINHVIEHHPDPIQMLNDIHNSLAPGGWVFGETENIDSLSFRTFRRYWSLLHLPYHLYFFTDDSLTNTFAQTKFSVPTVAYDIDPSTWVLSSISYLRRHQEQPRRAQLIPGYKLLLMAGAVVAQLERRKGPVLRFYAQKAESAH